jgi:hypothetical protein
VADREKPVSDSLRSIALVAAAIVVLVINLPIMEGPARANFMLLFIIAIGVATLPERR